MKAQVGMKVRAYTGSCIGLLIQSTEWQGEMRSVFNLRDYNTAITREDFEKHFTKTREKVRFTFNGWDGASYH